MAGCDPTQLDQTRMVIGALVVLCNTIAALVVIATRRKNGGA